MAKTTKPENFKKWLDALRSGEYKQGQKQLRVDDGDGTFSHCCLGVACDVSGIGHWEGETDFFTRNSNYDPVRDDPDSPSYNIYDSEPEFNDEPGDLTPEMYEWLGISGLVQVSWNGNHDRHVAILNDIDEWTFEQIADALEKEYL